MKIIFLCAILLLYPIPSAYAILWINDFNGQDLGGNWSVANIDDSNTTHTAEATAQAGYIASATGQYSTAVVTEGDWGGTYDGQYFSLYVWGNGNVAETLQIQIVEEDDVAGVAVDETWSTAATPLGWTGWRYLMFQIPFANSAGGDGTWNPQYTAPGPPVVRGVKSINFDTNANIYIDEIVISNVTSADNWNWIRGAFTFEDFLYDKEADNIDITVSSLPRTISAVFVHSAFGGIGDLTDANNRIAVIDEDPTGAPGSPTTNLCASYGASDGVAGWLASSESFVDGSTYTIFIRPNSGGEPGKCEVFTFTISVSSPSSTIENKYKRSLIN